MASLAPGATDDASSGSSRQRSVADHILTSALWLALYTQWLSILPVVMPDQIAAIVGPDNPAKAGIAGTIAAVGAIVSLIITPVAGALSDRLRAPRGRRRPFLISGMLLTCASLLPLALFGGRGSVFLYALVILNLQIWWNWTAGAYAGLVPDVVPAGEQSVASGWLNVMTIGGTILGNVLVWALYRTDRVLPLIGVFIVLSLVCLMLTLRGGKESPSPGAASKFDLGAFVRSFFLDPRSNANMYWVLVTRLFANMGIWSVFTFLLFYIESVLGLDSDAAVKLLSALLGAGTFVAVPASIFGARLADRHGLVRVVRITSWIMAAAVSCFAVIAFNPNMAIVAVLTIIFGAANGAYGAVDWALALKVLPAGQNAGKDMGIWHVSMVLPQIAGPAAMGWLITLIEKTASARAAYATAFVVAAMWFTLAAALVNRVKIAVYKA
jgi:Na+/melibiose symporter-like transporter